MIAPRASFPKESAIMGFFIQEIRIFAEKIKGFEPVSPEDR